ncbi:amidohydrolase [Sphingobium aromaticiconvertens]|uniref:amidohydrolase n=1 Tax=Sphingobium aromaticiconvertens TaxID=365341 RepID=UPI0030188BE8
MTHSIDLSRRSLLTATVAVGALGAMPALAEQAKATQAKATLAPDYVLKNIVLETGYAREAGEVIGTLTQKAAIVVRQGKIAAVIPDGGALPVGLAVRDGGGMLLLPSFRDMHIHLDKTFYGGPWVPPRKRKGGIAGQIKLENTLLPKMLPTLEERASKLVELLQGNGTTFARSQCNVDPVIGTKHVELLRHALEQRNATFGHEIVAFPQHGLVSANLIPTMRAAMAAGATHVGGIDPTAVDGGMEKSVDAMMDIAITMKKGVDIHLHEPGASGIAAIRRIADTVEREPSLKGKVTLSHSFSLMSLSEPELAELATRLAALDISVASTLPFGGRIMPIPGLLAKGVKVYTGTDSVMDHWSVFGSGDVLEKAKLACQLYGWSDEYGISQSLKIATGGPTSLNAAGEQVWPKPGDAADMVLVPASCSAEAVARQAPRKAVFHGGNLAAGALPDAVA